MHAKDRFSERTKSRDKLSFRLLWSAVSEIKLTRVSPSWRKKPESIDGEPDLYLLFPFVWENGVEDEGCLVVQREINDSGEDAYIAKTFFSKQSNNPEYYAKTTYPSSSMVREIAKIAHLTEKEVRQMLSEKPSATPPSWLRGVDADAWIYQSHWAVALKEIQVGSGNPYNYTWGDVYDLKHIKKEKARKRYRKIHRKK